MRISDHFSVTKDQIPNRLVATYMASLSSELSTFILDHFSSKGYLISQGT